MKFFGKKTEDNEEEVVVNKPSMIEKINNIAQTLNRPLGNMTVVNPNRTPRERQLGIPEYISPQDRVRDFSVNLKPIAKQKKVITNWRPTPGKPSQKGNMQW